MDTFKFSQNYGSHCDNCGKTNPGKATSILEVKGVQYSLCDDCFRLLIGQLYLSRKDIFEEFIKVLGKNDKKALLTLINS